MPSLTNSIVTDFIDTLIDEMRYDEAVHYLTIKWAEVMQTIIENPQYSVQEKEVIMNEVLFVLRLHGIQDISYELKDTKVQ